jgi:ATP-binding cassette subfamily F protein uup
VCPPPLASAAARRYLRAMAPPLLTLRDVHLALGGVKLLAGAELMVGEGERLALVGRNGSGKSSFLKVAAGTLEPDRGERVMRSGVTIRYLPQEPDLTGSATVLDYVEASLGPADDLHRARRLLEALGLTGDEPTTNLSGGEARRAAIAAALAPDPDILLLDEPTNHLDLPAIEWLEDTLANSRAALVLISHDRRFLERLSKTTLWLDRGLARRTERGFSEFEAWRDQILAEEEQAAHKLSRKIAAEEHWLRYGVTARRTRNERRLAGLHELRRQYRERRRATGDVQFAAAEAEVSGKVVIEAEHVAKSYDGRPIVKDFSTRIARGDRLGIVGANGAGKTTLIKLLTGEIAPDDGKVKLGTKLTTVTLDQRRALLDPRMTLQEVLTRGRGDTVTVGSETRHVVSYMKDFLFSPDQARTPVSVLSGGERGRLLLARALSEPANLLVLDEPTNDLDLETLDLLEEMLADHPGTVLVVSHDRDFLDRVATSVIFAEGDGRFTEYAGGYSDLLAQRGAGVSARKADRATPTRSGKGEPEAGAPRPERKARLSSQERKALDTLPARIDQLGASATKLRGILADPTLYAKDPTAFAKASRMLSDIEQAIAVAENEWLALEMKREEIEG